MSSTHPRRRTVNSTKSHVTQSMALPLVDPKQCRTSASARSLRKGSTFHVPSSPPSSPDDPILDIPSLPRRSPTCPKALEELVAAHEKRVADLIDSFDRSFSCQASSGSPDYAHKEALPVPSFMLAHFDADLTSLGLDKKIAKNKPAPKADYGSSKSAVVDHHHTSDSGLGSSVSESVNGARTRSNLRLHTRALSQKSSVLSGDSVYSTSTDKTTAINKSFSSAPATEETHYLSEYATKQIQQYIVQPILAETTLAEFHSLIQDIQHRISDRAITCLRDLEKTLIFLAPGRSSSATSYLNFCETSIQCIHTTVDYLNDLDQRRPTDRPYTNNYFLDLVEQVRQYARIMAATRQKEAAGEELDEMDYSPDEKVTILGGLSQNGQPAELVREKDGKMIPIEGSSAAIKRTTSNISVDEEDISRSMARKRKCDIGKEEIHPCQECGKEFKRPCDLTKHEKTHSRPWKCSDKTCKYYELGWPTEKERDRHVNDKHSSAPPLFKCQYAPCTYTSKRESNCKQHMEKSHGWQYVRSKSKNNGAKSANGRTPQTPLIPTPASAFPSISTPDTPFAPSPSDFDITSSSRDGSVGFGINSVHQQSSGSAVLFNGRNTFSSAFSNEGSNAFDLSAFDQGLNVPFNQGHSDGGQDSLNTPSTSLTHSSPKSVAPNSFEDHFTGQDFTFGNNSGFLPPVAEFFTQYHAQQPTPAMSDLNCGPEDYLPDQRMQVDQGNHHAPELSPGARADMPLFDPNDPNTFHEDEGISTEFTPQRNDFTLFGEIVGSSTAAGSMFPDLGSYDTVGSHFDTMYNAMNEGSFDDFGNSMFPRHDQH